MFFNRFNIKDANLKNYLNIIYKKTIDYYQNRENRENRENNKKIYDIINPLSQDKDQFQIIVKKHKPNNFNHNNLYPYIAFTFTFTFFTGYHLLKYYKNY
jgi:hypothetical protein